MLLTLARIEAELNVAPISLWIFPNVGAMPPFCLNLHRMQAPKNFEVVQLTELPSVACPCGRAQRAFADVPDAPGSVHLVNIENKAERHFHREMTEIYVVIEGEGEVELDGEIIAVKPFTAIMIRPGCKHRAVGAFNLNPAVGSGGFFCKFLME